MTNLLDGVWDDDADGQTQWSIIRDCMLQACNELLGRVGRKQPDWLTAAQSSPQPLIMRCNMLFSHWLHSGSFAD